MRVDYWKRIGGEKMAASAASPAFYVWIAGIPF